MYKGRKKGGREGKKEKGRREGNGRREGERVSLTKGSRNFNA